MSSRRLCFLAPTLMLIFCALSYGAGKPGPFVRLRATIKQQTTGHEEIQVRFLKNLDSAEEAMKKHDYKEMDRLLDSLGNDIFDSQKRGLSSDAVYNILQSASESAKILFDTHTLDHYWTVMAVFPDRRCNLERSDCRDPDPTSNCAMVTVCGVFKGCVSAHK